MLNLIFYFPDNLAIVLLNVISTIAKTYGTPQTVYFVAKCLFTMGISLRNTWNFLRILNPNTRVFFTPNVNTSTNINKAISRLYF